MFRRLRSPAAERGWKPRMWKVGALLAVSAAMLVPSGAQGQLPDLPIPIPTDGLFNFDLKDGPIWFDSGIDVFGTKSLGAGVGSAVANFVIGKANTDTVHTVTSLIWPDGATGFPVQQTGGFIGTLKVTMNDPGLYAFQCTIHPYMLAAMVVDDPTTPGLDFGRKLRVRGFSGALPSYSDYIFRLVKAFFLITNPGNWKVFSDTETMDYDPSYPPAPIATYDRGGSLQLIPNLDLFYQDYFNEGETLAPLKQKPKTPGVGEVWIGMQMEEYAGKSKPGSVTAVNTSNWTVSKKFALPQINLNNPHNMWTDRAHKVLYVNEWFGDKTNVVNRNTGEVIRRLKVGPSPAHVMTRTDNDALHIGLNGGNAVVEAAPGATKILRKIAVTKPGQGIAHPHAHWMSGDAKYMIAPNANFDTASLVNIKPGTIKKQPFVGSIPIASGMSPDGKKSYVASLMGNHLMCISNERPACVRNGKKVETTKIDLFRSVYDPVTGAMKKPGLLPGILPIQNAVSPDGQTMLVANAVSGNISVVDPQTDKLIKTLPCDPGCHGINWGAKKGGGYYGYVSSKFANTLIIVDGDPNRDGNPADTAVVGHMILNAGSSTKTDDTITNYPGMGGQGVLPLPLAYNGWVQKVPKAFASQLTCNQRNPIKPSAC